MNVGHNLKESEEGVHKADFTFLEHIETARNNG
jgi:hypothetical protein